MTADKHRQPGDADKHLQDWRTQSTTTDALGIDGFETVEKDGEIDLGVNANKAEYTINDPGADAYLIHVVDWNGGGNSQLGIRVNDYGEQTGEDEYRWQAPNGSDTRSDTSWVIGGHGSSNKRPGFGRLLVRRAGGANYVGMATVGGWSRADNRKAAHGTIREPDPLDGEITSFVFLERNGNVLVGGTARIARVTLG